MLHEYYNVTYNRVPMLDKFIHKTLNVPYRLNIYSSSTANSGNKTTLVFLHGIGSSGAMWNKAIEQLNLEKVNIISVDLLGFGKSPSPSWAEFDAKIQARALNNTLNKLRGTRVVLVGHSMGSLVAIEYAARNPSSVYSMVLFSPPLYDTNNIRYIDKEFHLKKFYNLLAKHPKRLIQISNLANKYGLVGEGFSINDGNVSSYISALKATIINQSSFQDLSSIDVPIDIIYGKFDPFIVKNNLRRLSKHKDNIKVVSFTGGHEFEGNFIPVATKFITNHLDQYLLR